MKLYSTLIQSWTFISKYNKVVFNLSNRTIFSSIGNREVLPNVKVQKDVSVVVVLTPRMSHLNSSWIIEKILGSNPSSLQISSLTSLRLGFLVWK